MREHKYRVFLKETGKYINQGVDIGKLSLPENWERYFILEKYIGPEDKNKKELCEGDIVMCYCEGEESGPHTIVWHGENGYPAFDLSPSVDTDSNGISHYLACGEIEIIGNIHEGVTNETNL